MKKTDLIYGTRLREGVAMLVALCLMAGAASLTANAALPLTDRPQTPAAPQVRHPDWISRAIKGDVSRPLRDIPARITQSPPGSDNEHERVPRAANPFAADSVVQKLLGPLAMPTPILNFDGVPNVFGPIPPDTNGDVGRSHYVQIVNLGFQIWDKNGATVYGPANNNTLFTGFGGPCEARNDGDPIALYDGMADRWVLTWFTSAAPYMECIAVSTSPDPTGPWYRYAFLDNNPSNTLGDYPKMSVWPDAYYMTTNEFAPSFVGDGNYAYNRTKMLVGDPSAELVYFHGTDGGKLPSDVDGGVPPPAGSPNYFITWDSGSPGRLFEYKFHVDFATPANSTYTGPFSISVADFNPSVGGIPQPITSTLLDSISDRLMFRLAYRNMGTHEALVVNHTVNAGGVAGIRWYELRNPNSPTGATVFQQGTFAPADGVHRWMGSAAMDKMGDIAVGYSASSSTVYPGIRYAGRLVTDPLGELTQGEATLLNGTGAEDFPAAHRWGDYSAMQVDPSDDCTFWYTTMHFPQTSLRAWRTRIGSFKFPSCVSLGTATPYPTPTGPRPTNTPTRATATPCAGNISYTGSITNTDPIQMGRLGLSDPKSSCIAPRPVPATSDTLARHHRTYTYTNSSASPQCVTVSIVQNCGNNALQSVTYLGTFNPNSITTNFLAHGGASGQQFSYSFTLPAGQTAVVAALETSPNLGCANYNLAINPCGPGGPTNTPTSTITPSSPTVTPTTVCVGTTYQTYTSTGAHIIPGIYDIGNHCDDCVTRVDLPFPVTVYGTVFTSTNVGTNGLVNFGTTQPNINGECLPIVFNNPPYTYTLFPYYDDLRTDVMTATHGIYSATVGVAPNRNFVLEWRTTYYYSNTAQANLEVIFRENSPSISYIYGATDPPNDEHAAATGIQLNAGQYTSYSCHTDIPAGTQVIYVPVGCGTPTPAPTCTITFTDVGQTDYFYEGVRWLYCRGAISGYADNTFRPYNNTTRSQMVKIIVLAYGMTIYTPPTPTFRDEPASDTFYQYVETAAHNNIVSGYNCGAPGEPCPGLYYRPYNLITRGQLSKIIVVSAGWALLNPPGGTFNDVPPGSTFYDVIETAVCHGVVSGYDCGGPGEPCPGRYFRPGNNATRGQIAKMVYNAVSNLPCITPTPLPTATATATVTGTPPTATSTAIATITPTALSDSRNAPYKVK